MTVTDGVDSCSGPAPDGACALTLNAAGVYTLTASYQGDESGTAVISAPALSTGVQSVTIHYLGDDHFSSGEADFTETVLNYVYLPAVLAGAPSGGSNPR